MAASVTRMIGHFVSAAAPSRPAFCLELENTSNGTRACAHGSGGWRIPGVIGVSGL
jgi:hypothetical protein